MAMMITTSTSSQPLSHPDLFQARGISTTKQAATMMFLLSGTPGATK